MQKCYTNITSIDFSSVVIEKMREKYAEVILNLLSYVHI